MKLRHGGELRGFSENYGIPEKEILDFSSNINPLGPPDSVKEVYESSLDELQVYPDPEALEFRREVARHFPLWPENVIAGNGAAELLDLVLRWLRPKRALLIEPTFLEYRRLLNLHGAEIRSVLFRERENFQVSTAEILNAMQGIDTLLLARPNNPTGSLLEKAELQKVLAEAKRRNIFVIFDEAFVDWVPEQSMAREVRDDSHFFVIRSLTKFFSLPGIRVGYGLGTRKLIEKLASYQVPWSCNRLAQKLGTVALRDSAFVTRSLEWLSQEREDFQALLREILSLKVYPSRANFLLVRDAHASLRVKALGRLGIYVRDLADIPGLGSQFVRLSVRRRQENLRLIDAMRTAGEQGVVPTTAEESELHRP